LSSDLATQVREITWYHQIELPGGLITPGVADVKLALSRLDLPRSLAGKTVLDVGAWDGFYSFEAARRGADRILATDSFVWNGRWGQRGFKLARANLGLEGRVEDKTIDVMDLSPESLGGKFDVSFFLGVLYHLVDPITAIQRVASVTNELLILETETALNFLPFPAARLWPADELAGDDTNWWSINQRGLIGLLRAIGFREVRAVYRTPTSRRIGRAIRDRNQGVGNAFQSARIVLHARR
jgi:tRNA (mo5U34)-methyltransferase